MIPIVSIVGKSNSGKTTLIEQLIPELIKRGYQVAVIKHHLDSFEIDHKGKDSWRHKQAGAKIVVVSSPQKIALIEDVSKDHSLEELATQFIRGVDIIITEGFKRDRHPKVEVYRKNVHHQPLADELENLIAMVSDEPIHLNVPCIGFDDIPTLADIIESQVIEAR